MANSSTATVTIIISGFGIIIQVSSRDQSFSDSAQVLFILGGMRNKGFLNSSSNLNDKQVGLYICNITSGGIPANAPDDMNTSFIYIGFGEGSSWGAQIIITTSSETAMYFRSYVSSSIKNWKKVQIQ